MTRTENEQELVLGNKQLLSAFFVVVALLGVFFTMGYIIGRNTGGNAAKESTAKDSNANASPPPDTSARASAPEPAASAPVEASPEPPSTPKAREQTRRPAPKTSESVPEAGAVSAAATIESAPGHQYLQVMAVKRPEADKMVALLRKHGMPALMGESSRPELYRVLVGPFSDTPSLARTKTALRDLGFDSVVSK